MGKSCKVENQLSAFLDGELSGVEAEQVKSHLEGCITCRQKLAELSTVNGLIKGMETVEPSAGFERAFWGKVADLEAAQENRWWKRIFQPGWRPVLATGLAAGLVVGVFFMTGLDKEVSPEDRFVAENADFLNEYDLVHDLEILQHWDLLEAMKELS